MSVFGRNFIDKLKSTLKHRSVLLPVPPYAEKKYWNKVYETLTASDVYEWGDFTLADLQSSESQSRDNDSDGNGTRRVMRYRHVYRDGIRDLYGSGVVVKEEKGKAVDGDGEDDDESVVIEEEFHEAIRVPLPLPLPIISSEQERQEFGGDLNSSSQSQKEEQSLLILGCGNSNFGEELYYYYNGHPSLSSSYPTGEKNRNEYDSSNIIQPCPITKIIQCDISPNVVQSMKQRYNLEPMVKDVDDNNNDHPVGSNDIEYDSNDFDNHVQKNEEPSDDDIDNSNSNSTLPPMNNFPHMSIVEADATDLPKSYHNQFNAVIDKGLIDALFCCTSRGSKDDDDDPTEAEDQDTKEASKSSKSSSSKSSTNNTRFNNPSLKMNMVPRVIKSVHGVLKPGAVFMFFSFSRPEYLLSETIVWDNYKRKHNANGRARIGNGNVVGVVDSNVLDLWSEVHVCELDRIFMYRFVKSDESSSSTTTTCSSNSTNGLDLDGLPSLRGSIKKRRR